MTNSSRARFTSSMGILYFVLLFESYESKRNVWKMSHVARIDNILETEVNYAKKWFAINPQGLNQWLFNSHLDSQVRCIGLYLWQRNNALIIITLWPEIDFISIREYMRKCHQCLKLQVQDCSLTKLKVAWFDISVIAISPWVHLEVVATLRML